MSYVKRTLGAKERILYRAHFHWSYELAAWLSLVLLGIVVVGLYIFARIMIRILTTEIVVTSSRFVLKTGFVTLHTEEVELTSVEEVRVTQSFWGRVLGYGQVVVRGTGVDAITTPTIGHPLRLRQALETALESTWQ